LLWLFVRTYLKNNQSKKDWWCAKQAEDPESNFYYHKKQN
jgi:hypothetical protein